jgi:dTDP-4-amino-4,6-dideoxygalactose transaminase
MKEIIARYDFASHFSESEMALITDDIKKLLITGDYILGEEVEKFESAFSAYHEVYACVGCNSGTDALILALMALDIKVGDEVIIPANTFYATALAVSRVGAVPVLVDVNPNDFLINPALISEKITKRTKAILVVHLYGQSCDMTPITKICEDHGLFLVEDCAQAHGARYHGQLVGTFGDIACFSFHPSKNLPAAGDAGACITNSLQLADKMRVIRHLGQEKQNYHIMLGLNSRLDSLQALILNYRLAKLDSWNMQRNQIAAIYKNNLRDLPVEFQATPSEFFHVYHLLQIKVANRDDVVAYLQSNGVDAVIRYPFPIHKQRAFAFLNHDQGLFPVSNSLAETLLCLPLHPTLSFEKIDRVCALLHNYFDDPGKL